MRFHKARRTAAALLVSMTTAITLAAVVSQPSQAATTSGYPSALVETNVAARDAPWRIYAGRDTYAGGTLPDPRTRGRQTASVMCWYDGEGVSGNYWTNRWFKVLVWALPVRPRFVCLQPARRPHVQQDFHRLVVTRARSRRGLRLTLEPPPQPLHSV